MVSMPVENQYVENFAQVHCRCYSCGIFDLYVGQMVGSRGSNSFIFNLIRNACLMFSLYKYRYTQKLEWYYGSVGPHSNENIYRWAMMYVMYLTDLIDFVNLMWCFFFVLFRYFLLYFSSYVTIFYVYCMHNFGLTQLYLFVSSIYPSLALYRLPVSKVYHWTCNAVNIVEMTNYSSCPIIYSLGDIASQMVIAYYQWCSMFLLVL